MLATRPGDGRGTECRSTPRRRRGLLLVVCTVSLALAIVATAPTAGAGASADGPSVPGAHAPAGDRPAPAVHATGSTSDVGSSPASAERAPTERTAVVNESVDVMPLSPARRIGSERSASFFQTNDTSVVFVADAERAAYWRLGSYDTLDGDRWERRDQETKHVTVGSPPPPERILKQQFWFNASTQTLPVAYEPDPNSFSGSHDWITQRSTAGMTIVFDEPLEEDSAHGIWSGQPPAPEDRRDDPVAEYPPALEEIYTELPSETTERFRLFTDELTADAETPYETARTIETWLRTQKEYDRGADHGGTTPVADEVVFEMDAVNAEYAATAMVAMLRSEGVPARYTVGYAPGVEHDGRYYVTEQDAHAWIEIYVPEDGWVPFDPTSPAARHRATREAHHETSEPLLEGARRYAAATDEVDAPATRSDLIDDAVAGDPDTVAWERDADGATLDAAGFEQAPATSVTERGYVVEWNRTTPTPTSSLAVTVTDGGEPLAGVDVAFDDRRVGTTGADGTVVATVPWNETLAVSAAATGGGTSEGASPAPPFAESVEVDVDAEDGFDVAVPETAVSGASVPLRATADGDPVTDAAVRVDGTETATTDANGTARVTLPEETGTATVTVERGDVREERTVSIRPLHVEAVEGHATPGATVTLEVGAGDRTLAGRAVDLEGTRVGTTDDSGRLQVQLPERTGDLRVSVESDDRRAETALTVADPTIEVGTSRPMPGDSTRVRVLHDGEPVEGATVTVGDRTVETGADGVATVGLPFANTARIEASVNGATASTITTGLYWNGAVTVSGPLAVVGLLGAGVFVARRRDVL